MPRPQPHPLALFSLAPGNERAYEVINNQANDHLVSTLDDGQLVLDIGHIRPKSGNNTDLTTLGREGDVQIDNRSIGRVQCSFEIDPETNVAMFHDKSTNQSSQVFGADSTPFQHGRPRKVVVQSGLNTMIGLGGERRDLVQFELIWHLQPVEAMEMVKDRASTALEENPRLAQTIDEADTAFASRRVTRPHTAGSQQSRIRYKKLEPALGSGTFGAVYKAINADTGKFMAVKILRQPATEQDRTRWFMRLKREVEALCSLTHPHIVDYIACQGWDKPQVELFMGLKDGSLESLVQNRIPTAVPLQQLHEDVFHQTLQALDFLATKDIIHRDVKPANVPYVLESGKYKFQLADFGQCNRASFAATRGVGSPIYMAPEMWNRGEQTHKVDVLR